VRIALASDHAGFSLKEEIKGILSGHPETPPERAGARAGHLSTLRGHELADFGTWSTDAADLSDLVHPAARAVSDGEADRAMYVRRVP
jgi:ribose 5-phosphate isomerase B